MCIRDSARVRRLLAWKAAAAHARAHGLSSATSLAAAQGDLALLEVCFAHDAERTPGFDLDARDVDCPEAPLGAPRRAALEHCVAAAPSATVHGCVAFLLAKGASLAPGDEEAGSAALLALAISRETRGGAPEPAPAPAFVHANLKRARSSSALSLIHI